MNAAITGCNLDLQQAVLRVVEARRARAKKVNTSRLEAGAKRRMQAE
jgi:hypothetical protein